MTQWRSTVAIVRSVLTVLIVTIFAARIATANAVTLVVAPASHADVTGSPSAVPFGRSSMRYQQVYSASQFSSGGMISEIAFRPYGQATTPTLSAPIASLKVVLSTTQAAPGQLNATFAENLGGDQTTVFDGPWSVSTSYTAPSGGTNAFDIRLRLTTPFAFDPSAGNLLVDVTIVSSAMGIPALDADTSSGTVSTVYADSAAAATATGQAGDGLITQFTYGSFAILEGCGAGREFAWLIFTKNLQGILSLDNGAYASLADHFFNNPRTLVAGAPSSSPVPAGWSSIALADYQSFRQFRKDLMTPGTINPAMTAVLYDNENWPQTFASERTSPAAYTALFANLAHAYGYAFVSAPGTDLVTVQTSPIAYDPTQKVYPQYLSMGFPAFSVNSPAEVYDIQAQGSEASTSTFTDFVMGARTEAALSQVGTVRPAVVLAGISTAPNGQTASADQMKAVLDSTAGMVSGYWLNIPDASAGWPKAVCFLQELASSKPVSCPP